jgi:hypothetical protein
MNSWCMLDAWDDLGSDLKGFQQNPQTINPLVNQKATLRIECTTLSHSSYLYGGLQYLGVCSQGRDWHCILFLFLMYHIYYSFLYI